MNKKKRSGNGNGTCHESGNGNGKGVKKKEIKSSTRGIAKPIAKRISITAKSENQKKLLKSIKENLVTITAGPAGSGKTLLAVVSGLREFVMGNYDKMIFTRPCVEANGENLGFLPGDLNEKINPYMYPIFEFLADYLTQDQIEYYMKENLFQTLPLAYQRGCTFKNAVVILDEGQNTTPEQFRMFLTRIGDNCKVIITGDPTQNDIKGINGLVDACDRLTNVTNLNIVYLKREDIFRNPIVAEIEDAYSAEKIEVKI